MNNREVFMEPEGFCDAPRVFCGIIREDMI